jgi:hypothetical protein
MLRVISPGLPPPPAGSVGVGRTLICEGRDLSRPASAVGGRSGGPSGPSLAALAAAGRGGRVRCRAGQVWQVGEARPTQAAHGRLQQVTNTRGLVLCVGNVNGHGLTAGGLQVHGGGGVLCRRVEMRLSCRWA